MSNSFDKTELVAQLTKELFDVSCQLDRMKLEQNMWHKLYQEEVKKRYDLFCLCIQKRIPLDEVFQNQKLNEK